MKIGVLQLAKKRTALSRLGRRALESFEEAVVGECELVVGTVVLLKLGVDDLGAGVAVVGVGLVLDLLLAEGVEHLEECVAGVHGLLLLCEGELVLADLLHVLRLPSRRVHLRRLLPRPIQRGARLRVGLHRHVVVAFPIHPLHSLQRVVPQKLGPVTTARLAALRLLRLTRGLQVLQVLDRSVYRASFLHPLERITLEVRLLLSLAFRLQEPRILFLKFLEVLSVDFVLDIWDVRRFLLPDVLPIDSLEEWMHLDFLDTIEAQSFTLVAHEFLYQICALR